MSEKYLSAQLLTALLKFQTQQVQHSRESHSMKEKQVGPVLGYTCSDFVRDTHSPCPKQKTKATMKMRTKEKERGQYVSLHSCVFMS